VDQSELAAIEEISDSCNRGLTKESIRIATQVRCQAKTKSNRFSNIDACQ
jgi:hypothetical protein